MTRPSGLDAQEAIDRLGFGRFQRRLLVICGLAWAADAAEVLLIGFALPSVVDEFGLSPAQAGAIVTAAFVGMLAGAWLSGPVADRVGRRSAFQVMVVLSSVFGGLTALSPDGWWLAALRALTGFGLGGALPVNFSLFAEFLPSRNRGRNMVLMESFWALGTILAAGLAWLLVPAFGWRPLLASTAATVLIVAWIRRYVPESPRYLVVVGRGAEARAVLEHVAAVNRRRLPGGPLRVPPPRPRPPLSALWAGRLRRTTAMLWAAWLCIALGYYGMFTWLPTVFVERGFTFLATYAYTFVLAVAQLPGYFSAAWLVERWGRPHTLAAYLLAAGVGTFAFALAGTTAAIVSAAALMSFFSLGAWGALYAYTPELYPTEMRATGVGWASGMTRLAGALAPPLGGLLLPVSLTAALGLYALAFVVGGAVVWLAGADTRGRPLSDLLPSRG